MLLHRRLEALEFNRNMIPDYQTLMLPLLQYLADGQQRRVKEIVEHLADVFQLTPEERVETIPSGYKPLFYYRVSWAKQYLKEAGLIYLPIRAVVQITDAGRQQLAEKPEKITRKLLLKYPSFAAFLKKDADDEDESAIEVESSSKQSPQEVLANAYKSIHAAIKADLLARLRNCSPDFFEQAVVKLLMAMGYGVEGKVVGKSGDGGIDGIIKEDQLGLDVVCVQAKRWEGNVGRPVVQAFVGSMDMQRARKGVILTTSAYSSEARDFVNKIESKKVVLIDGEQLADFMITHNIGVVVTSTYQLKEVSNDFFEEDE